MRDFRPVVARDDVIQLLEGLFGEPIHHLEPVEGGQVARTFSFTAGSEQYFLGINRRLGANVEKHVFVERLVRSSGIPIPPIVHRGRLGELYYAVTRRMPGTPLSDLDRSELDALVPSVIETLDTIHSVDVSQTEGYATAGDDGNGMFPSWRRYLEHVAEEEAEWDFFGRWHDLFETTFLERDLFDRASQRMTTLLPDCPEERSLIHGNVGYNNLLAQDGTVTAVLDWQDAGYGDSLYDVAQLDFWDPEGGWIGRFCDHFHAQGRAMDSYDERILCYQLRTALDALRFFAKKGDEGAYRWTRDRLSVLDDDGASRPG
ncbi:MAG TPA: aminoglycoside phosphotransferase family protein [Thermomicrobiales bacterium]|nr:aminoglycoside phosphotransferase family protein [Thermomicrobiales bacterium]